ncbi:hypothetical protein ACQ4PT_003970 [Festuca glaucescens]
MAGQLKAKILAAVAVVVASSLSGNNNFRGAQGFPPPNPRNPGSNSGYDNGQYRSGGNRWQQNDDWNSENNFDQPAFGGNFGDFDQGYFEAGQGYGQNYNGYGGAQRNRRQFHNYAQGNRGRGGRISRGRFNGRGYGGRFPQTDYQGQEVVNSGTNDPTATLPTVQSQTIAVGVTPIHVPSGTTTPQNEKLAAVVAAAVQSVGAELSKTSKKKDKSDGILCFRCDDTGHMAIDCTAELCLLCDSAKHKSAECHLHAMPKPTAVMYGLCRDELLFFDIPRSLGVRSKRNSGKVGRIRVTGGSLTVHQIAKELSFLIPGNHQWDITKTDDNVFKVVYPTKADFARTWKRLVYVNANLYQLIGRVPKLTMSASPKCKSARCAPIKLWGDRVENGEDDLPSPLPRFEMHEALDGVVHQDYQEEPEVDHQQLNDINLSRQVYEKVEICPLVSVAADYEVLDVPSDRVQLHFSSPSSLSGDSRKAAHAHGLPHEVPLQQEANVRASSPIMIDGATQGGSPKTPEAGDGLSTLLLSSMQRTPRGNNGKMGTGVFLGGRYSQADLIAFGGIPEPVAAGVRSSTRIHEQPNSDATQLARAQQLAEAQDNMSSPGIIETPKTPNLSIASIPNEVVIARASRLGVSLGKSPGQVSSSIEMIKEVDLHRTLFMLKKKEESASKIIDAESSLVLNHATTLSDDLEIEEHPGSVSHKGSTISMRKVPRANKKKPKENFVVRKSARLNKKN